MLFKHYVSEYHSLDTGVVQTLYIRIPQSRYWCCLNTMYQNTTVSILVLFKHYVSEYHSLNIGVVQTLYIRIPVSILVLFKHCIISEYHNLNISDTFTYFACLLLLFLLTFEALKGGFQSKRTFKHSQRQDEPSSSPHLIHNDYACLITVEKITFTLSLTHTHTHTHGSYLNT